MNYIVTATVRSLPIQGITEMQRKNWHCLLYTSGIQTADEMVKAGNVELLLSTPICPGKYVIIVGGHVGPEMCIRDRISCGR